MKQTLHIFAKDARRFWPEISISLAITALFAWASPSQWRNSGSSAIVAGGFARSQQLQMLAGVLPVLVPASWWLLIARVVHAESLVGDRQFWLTRPYEWKKLLAAKALFLLVFLYLPFVAAQLALLAAAGFWPFFYLPGLLFNLVLITAVLVMPLFALATVTSSFARLTLTVLGVMLGLLAIGLLASRLVTRSASIPAGVDLSIPLLLCTCTAAAVVQYATRRLWLSRWLLIALLLLFTAGALKPADSSAVDRAFAAAEGNAKAPLQVELFQDAERRITADAVDAKQVQVNVPLRISGVAISHVLLPEDAKVAIDAANGVHWSSPWEAAPYQQYVPGTQLSSVSFSIDRTVYERLKTAPLTLHLTLALTDARAGEAQRKAISANDFPVPGFGICSPQTGWVNVDDGFTGITCRAAFRQPQLTYIETLWSNHSCSASGPEADTRVPGATWVGDLDNAPAKLGISSIAMTPIPLLNSTQDGSNESAMFGQDEPRRPKPRYLCPGAPLTFTRYHLLRRLQARVDIPNVQLPAKISSQVSVDGSGFGIMIGR